jgi:hypothetical protein
MFLDRFAAQAYGGHHTLMLVGKGQEEMRGNVWSRRELLRETGVVVLGMATGGAVIFAENFAWALSTSALDPHTAETLMIMARQLFPHDRLGDQYYAAVVEAVDKQAARNAALRKLLIDGVAALDASRGLPWLALSDGGRISALKILENSEFFAAMRMATINNLYTNPLVYHFFGFEGSSVEHGGYIDRGFVDIGWPPNP